MKNTLSEILCALLLCIGIHSCTKPSPDTGHIDTPEKVPGFIEAVPDTTEFTNAQFIYNGDDLGEQISDGWVIKLYTDMDVDQGGNPIGPGRVVQMLLNVRYDPEQKGNPSLLKGTYLEMMSSGDFSAGTFVDGFMSRLDLPTGSIEIADATFYAELTEGSTEMDYDLIDEGKVKIKDNDDGTFTIEGILIGKKYTKRYFSWTGKVEPRNNAPIVIPNSTLENDLMNPVFTKGQIQDKGDCFFLRDESYRCLLIYLGDDGIKMTQYRPEGEGAILRLEILVPWNTDIHSDGIPSGTYTMIPRNENASIDRELITPGGALTGLPDVFEAWKLSGSWYYEMTDGKWTGSYARINGGTITIEKGEDGAHTVEYDLIDCQDSPKKICGSTTLVFETV